MYVGHQMYVFHDWSTSFQCRKTKVITMANRKERKYHMITRNQWGSKVKWTNCSKRGKTRENAGDQVAIGFGSASYWLKRWASFYTNNKEQGSKTNVIPDYILEQCSIKCRKSSNIAFVSLYVIVPENLRHPLNENQSRFDRPRFPALLAVGLFSLGILIGSLWYFPDLWLAAVITVVLALQHSIKMRCILDQKLLWYCDHTWEKYPPTFASLPTRGLIAQMIIALEKYLR